MNKVPLLLASLLLGLAPPVAAQWEPPPGAVGIDAFASPVLLGGAGDPATFEPPASDALNPAGSGAAQRTTLDFSYVALAGVGEESGLGGSALNAGITRPTRVGVFGAGLSFRSASFDSVDWGSLVSLNLSFAKDLFPNLLVGAGLSAVYGSQEETDWGLGLDVGFVHLAGDAGLLRDLRWGAAVRDIGKGYAPDPDRDPFPAPFTPAVGARAVIAGNESFALGLAADLSAPSFAHLAFAAGAEAAIRDTVFLRASYLFDAAEAFGDLPQASLPFSFGATVRIKTAARESADLADAAARNWNRSEVRINLSATPMPGDVWAFGVGVNVPLGVVDRDPPRISLGAEPQVWISPNQDGVQDDFVTSLSIEDERYVKGYRFVIADPSGRAIRTILNKDDRPENVTFKNVLDRLRCVKSGIAVPETLRWDGLSDQAEPVGDGAYSWHVEAWDDNGNAARSDARTIVVDNTPPTVEVSAPYLVFSPNGDGNKDALPVRQSGSVEDLWTGTVGAPSGSAVASMSWKQSAPQPFQWDGRDDAAVLVPDGVYRYRVEATDRAGNRGSADLPNIIVNTQATPVTLSVDRAFFSPNGDGVRDTVELVPLVPVESGIERWTLTIEDSTGRARRAYAGERSAPTTTRFDGRDSSGRVLPEGTYRAVLEVRYVNGNRPVAASPTFVIDLTPPSVSVRADLAVFSPNGDGNKDTVTIYQETSEEVGWAGTVRDELGRVVASFFWRGRADTPATWDGRGDDGRLLADGLYTYVLQTSDRAGNAAESMPLRIRLDTEETPVIVSADLAAFSPNGDGSKDRNAIVPQLRRTTDIDSYELRILDSSGRTVRTVTGRTPVRFDWDGRTDSGARAVDGSYAAELSVLYSNGNRPKARSAPFVIDTAFPQIELAADRLLFSPDGDGRADAVRISQKSSTETLWEGEIRRANREPVRSLFWKGAAADLVWDGTDEHGNVVPDGTYSYAARAVDQAGNRIERRIDGIVVDARQTPIFVTAGSAGFSPNGDGVLDAISFALYVNLAQGIESWELALLHSERGPVKTFSGGTSVPAKLVWDGAAAPEGLYTARFRVAYLKGNRPESVTAPFRLDVTPPKTAVTVAPRPFSPDNDGVDDEVRIGLEVSDASAIEAWALEVLDPTGKVFRRWAGSGRPAGEIIWDGLSPGGELVQAAEDYPVRITVSDQFGNRATAPSVIPVDVLVIREGDKLKIRISSITFAADTADYLGVDPDKVEKNLRALKRLAEIFEKYRAYNVHIEGHAVNLNWADAARAEREETEELAPLSLARAESVKEALIELGMDGRRITTEGLGGRFPLVPHGDLDNRWKNRRVEFILVRGDRAR